MKTNMKYIMLLLAFVWVNAVSAQNFFFEEQAVPSSWVATQGTLSTSNEHYKEGSRSLKWDATSSSIINISFPQFTASTSNAAFFQIYNPIVSNDTLVVEFLNNNNVRRRANVLLNFRGWRDFERAYTEYASNTSFTVTSVRISLKPSSVSPRVIYFDNVRFNHTTNASRIFGSHWLLDKDFFKSNNVQLNLFANAIDINVQAPSAEELSALSALRSQLPRSPAAGNNTTINNARNFANGLNIVRNADGSVRGNVVDMSANALTNTVVTSYVNHLEILAAEGLKDNQHMQLFHDLLDHLLDQGFAEGVQFLIRSNDYTASRNIPAKLLNILPAGTPQQRDEVLKLVRWISYYGMLYESESTYLQTLNSDVVYLYLPHMLAYAVAQPNDAVAVRELKAMKRFFERNSEYVPGGSDILKPDGTGFHHATHYNNYMYAYQTWIETLNYFKATPFRIGIPAYERIKKAIVSKYIMATLDNNNTRHFANALSGRNPFGPGISLYFSRNLFEDLIAIGGDVYGVQIDENLAAAYNYFFRSSKYDVPAQSFEGFHQFNYSPMGIYRKNNWVATMRAPTTKFWGAEIYNAENRFGRYQSHGSLEITYSGTPATSGFASSTGGGWDWNVVPGTTTVHYSNWQDMMPNRNITDRFDQYTKTKNFAGALSWGDCGIFAADFDQGDAWGSQRFVPTNLEFKKSYFAFDDIIIALGSNIASSGTYSNDMITATNLFQNLTSSLSGQLLHNGVVVERPSKLVLPANTNNWLLAPQGTGYFIPRNNDELVVVHDFQRTPYETGSDFSSPITNAVAAKAYINHGVKPSNKQHSFVVVPATNADAMAQLATQLDENGGSIYQLHAQNSNVHALTYLPKQITAYAFFQPASNLNFGLVKEVTAQHLLLLKPDAETQHLHFAAANPNLQPVNDAAFGWRASPTETKISIDGEWMLANANDKVFVHNVSNAVTDVSIMFEEGEPVYFSLKPLNETAVDKLTASAFEVFVINNHLRINAKNNSNSKVNIYSAMGQLMLSDELVPHQQTKDIPLHAFRSGVYMCVISNGNSNVTYKWIKK